MPVVSEPLDDLLDILALQSLLLDFYKRHSEQDTEHADTILRGLAVLTSEALQLVTLSAAPAELLRAGKAGARPAPGTANTPESEA